MRARVLLVAIAVAAAACGGDEPFPPGGDPWAVDADGDGHAGPNDCDDADPNAWDMGQAYRDADGDGRGAGALTSVCRGPSTPPGWSEVGDDCDDGDRWRYLTLTGYADDDLDGAGTGSALAVCTNGALPAGYAFTAGDCDPLDGTAWQDLVYSYLDSDGDGVTLESAGVVCAGAALPAGYQTAPGPYYYSDCDDADRDVSFAIAVYPDTDGDSYGAGDRVVLCSGGPVVPSGWSGFGGDCEPGDPARWQLLSYAGVDADLDGHAAAASGTVCAGAALPPPYSPWGGEDCDDGDPSRWRLLSGYADDDGDAVGAGSLVEVCTSVVLPDGIVESGGDCAPSDPSAWRLLAGYADADDDAVGAGALVEVCTSVALPHGVVASGGDCAPSDPAAWRPVAYTFRDADGDTRTVAEAGSLCVGAQAPAGYTSVRSGDDCDDLDPTVWTTVAAYFDADGDGTGAGPSLAFCTDGSIPADHAPRGGDCAPTDAAAWRVASYAYMDGDRDGYTVKEAGQVCAGATLPDPYRAAANGNDCDDDDPALYRWVVLYRDLDGDGVGAGTRTIPCLGEAIPEGFSTGGYDADDSNPGVQSVAAGDDLVLGL